MCRWLDYEIIDQNSFEVPTLDKNLKESLSLPGKKSISIPLGEVKITREVKSLTVYFRSCAKVHLWNQNKKLDAIKLWRKSLHILLWVFCYISLLFLGVNGWIVDFPLSILGVTLKQPLFVIS